MEELENSLENIQYVSAISDTNSGPRPLTDWDVPTEAALIKWKDLLKSEWNSTSDKLNIPEPLEFKWAISSALGFFLFSSYLKEECKDYLKINFIEEILRWRRLRGQQQGSLAKRIVNTYLQSCPIKSETQSHVIPQMSLIEEHYLEYTPLLVESSNETLNDLLKNNLDETCAKCCIGLDGPVRQNIIETVLAISSNNVDELSASPKEQGNDLINNETVLENENGPLLPSPNHKLKESKKRSSIFFSYLPSDVFDIVQRIVMEDLRRRYWDGFLNNFRWTKLLNFLWYQDRRTIEEDFYVMRVLGRGGFGLVTACKKGVSGKLYAMKVMNKKRIKIKKSERFAINERASLAAVDSPFIVNLKYTFQSRDDIYLILDLMTGGDLSFHLSQKHHFSTNQCLYYASRIMLGLQALHDKNYVYRDLKPENCLLAEDGRVRITDLGLATLIHPKLRGAAGTRGYWAPEMLKKDKEGNRLCYDQRVDWFSFGCLVAEMISGISPFRCEDAIKFGKSKGHTKKDKAVDCATLEMEPKIEGKRFNKLSVDFCRRLLDKNEESRLGANGCEEIMSHAWFHSLKWEIITSDLEEPPFVPAKDVNAASQSEIGTFEEDSTYNKTEVNEKDNEVYKDWDWTNPKAFSAEVIEFLIYERKSGKPLRPLHSESSCCCALM